MRLLQESQFLQLNTWLLSLSILYNNISSAIVLDPEKNRVKVFLDHGVLRKSLGYNLKIHLQRCMVLLIIRHAQLFLLYKQGIRVLWLN